MRYYSSVAAETALAAPCSGPATTIAVTATTGFPVSFPYTLCLDAETVNKELVEVTAAAGTSLTVTRGVDGTSAVAHTLGATVSHDHSARDFRESREHETATSAHGVAGVLVGTTDTQTLTNKDLSSGNTFPPSLATDAEVTTAVGSEATARAAADTTETNARIAADATKAALVHTHAESDVTGLVADLAAKAPVSTTVTLTGAQTLTNKTLTSPITTRGGTTTSIPYKVANFADLPASGMSVGDLATVTGNAEIYEYNGSAWLPFAGANGAFNVTGVSPFSNTLYPVRLGRLVLLVGSISRATGSSTAFTTAASIDDSSIWPALGDVTIPIGSPSVVAGVIARCVVTSAGLVRVSMSGAASGDMAVCGGWYI